VGCYAASGNFLPTFRGNLAVLSSRVKNPNEKLLFQYGPYIGKSVGGEYTRILSTRPGYMDRLTKEAVELDLRLIMKREDGLTSSRSWKSLLRLLRKRRRPPQ
jgi:hypothetical protein